VPKDNYTVHDKRFYKLIHFNAGMDHLWTGGRWTEGPAYLAAGRYLIWSDIPNDRLMRWDETDGSVSVFEHPCGNQNGHTVDRQGRLVACEHRRRVVSCIGFDGARRVIADSFEGRRFNSPNDVVVKSDATVWFSDPTYGIDSEYEGDSAASEIGASNVYRVDSGGNVTAVVTDMVQPNGLAFSPDESVLYVADTGFSHDQKCKPKIRSYPLSKDGTKLGKGKDFVYCDKGLFDGFRVDTKGNIWSSAGDGVHCFAPDGTLLGRINVPEVVSNVCFGGRKRNRLFITATTSLFAIYVNAQGCPGG
jgi:gluconolactonase